MSSRNNATSSLSKRIKGSPTILLDILGIVITQHFLPQYTWDEVEECLGWCKDRELSPTPLKMIGKAWKERALALRRLLIALHVRATPEMFCGPLKEPHPIALLLGQILAANPKWQTEAYCCDPGMWLIDGFSRPLSLWWYENRHMQSGRERRLIEEESPVWSQTENPGIEEEYFKLWKNLNGLYERLSIPWKVPE